MEKFLVIWCFATSLILTTGMEIVNDTQPVGNSSDTNKDMYVIHAMVYQVGVVTNRTDNETANMNTTGNQEALTFYHNNGSQIDLSRIPTPLLTNVTAQSLVGVAPVVGPQNNTTNQLPWSTFNHLTDMASPLNSKQGSNHSPKTTRLVRNADPNLEDSTESSINKIYKRLFKRNTAEGGLPVAIRKGAALIPQTAGVQSIAIPPLLTLNNNLSHIPVPIPNTSVVQYAKINTLLTSP